MKIVSGTETPGENEDVVLQCVANASSTPTIVWYYNNTLLTTNFASMEQSEDLLFLRNISANVSGLYSCKATLADKILDAVNPVSIAVHCKYLFK